jgi:membrane-bound metal-dependent hydrolase YbcI (DUF457 family)
MFIGHFGVALAAKRAVPAVSLGSWFIACELVDLLWPVCLLLGIESVRVAPGATAFTPLGFDHYPWTHSLLMCAVWAVAMGAFWWRRSRVSAMAIALVVVSHWFLDAIVHRPDLPLVPGAGVRIGLGVWDSIAGTLALEVVIFIVGLGLYLGGSQARDRTGRWAAWTMVALLLVAYASAAFGPPPPSVSAIAWVGLAGGAVFGWLGYWVDRHRVRIASEQNS